MRGVFGLSLAALASASPVVLDQSIKEVAPLVAADNAKIIADNYIIVFKKHVTEKHAADHHNWVQSVHDGYQVRKTELKKRSQTPLVDDIFSGIRHTYNIAGGLLGYSGHFDEDVIEQIRRHPDVEMIERDQEVHALEQDAELEKNSPWGLARVSNREQLGFGNFNKYYYSADGGEGVDVYVIDTGTNVDHVDFEGRATWGKTIPSGDEDKDGNGHGTHCSGTIAGKKYGVSKKAHVKAVKVLRSNGSGSMSDVVKGVEYAAEQHSEQVSIAKKGKRKGFKGSAANMSLGGGKSAILDQAVNAAVDAGIHFAVAAGNDNADACNYSPASATKAVTVGASTLGDERAYFSNWGKCTDIFAPGLNIQSTWTGSKYAVKTISGTSMASPHIAGLLAYLLSLQPAKDSSYAVAEITPKKLKDDLISIGTVGALSDIPSSTPNILAWNGGGSSNYSSIIKKGGYKVAEKEQVVSIDFGKMEDDITSEAAKLSEKITKLTGKVEDLVAEELKDFFRELREE